MTRKRSKAERSDAIVGAAVVEFMENGFESASMEAIARRCGVSKGCLYHHFSGKDEIFLYAAQCLSEPVERLMKKAQASASAREGLRGYIRGYLRHWQKRPQELGFFFLSLAKVMAQPALWAMYQEYAERMFDFFQRLLERGVERGEFGGRASRERGVALMSALDGAIGYLMFDRKLRLEAVASEIERLFLPPADEAGRRGEAGG